jgi:hypothetical protein
MSRLGIHKFTTEVELCYSGPGEEPILVDIEVAATLHCDSTEDGVYASEIEAEVVSRKLTEDEVKLLDLECNAVESFCDSPDVMPAPADGTRVKDAANQIWTVVASGCHWDTTEKFVVMERWTLEAPLGKPSRRVVPMVIFFDEVERDGKLVPRFEIIEESHEVTHR